MSSRVKLYDNGGKTADRYSLFVPSVNEPGKEDWYSFSESPYHPQGVGMYGGADYPMPSYRHMGRLISYSDLPEQAKRYVKDTLTQPLPDGYGMPLPQSWGGAKKKPARRKSSRSSSSSLTSIRGLRR